MQNDAHSEFLQANSRRTYPFSENVSLFDDGSAYELPAAGLLNLRGFTRQQPEDPAVQPHLAALVGPSATSLPGPYQNDTGGWALVFRLGTMNQGTGTSQFLRVVLDPAATGRQELVGFVPSQFSQAQPAGDMANLGLHRHPITGSVADYDYLAAMIQITAAEGIADLMPVDDTARYYFSDAMIEPALLLSLWRTEIERLVVEDPCWEEADVSGEVVLREGYNMEVVRLDSAIQLAPARRAGRGVQSAAEFEVWNCLDETPDLLTEEELRVMFLEPCLGNILRVNGIGPDENHEFKIFGENGITIQNFPNDHLIVINADIPQPVAACPPAEVDEVVVESSSSSSSGPAESNSPASSSSISSSAGPRPPDAILDAFLASEPFDNDLFSDYPNKIWNPSAWAAAFDFTGVPFEGTSYPPNSDTRRGVLIGRDCFLCANHWGPRQGFTVAFTDKAGGRHTRTVIAEQQIGGVDARVGQLDSPVPASITSYAVVEDLQVGEYAVATRSRPVPPIAQKCMIEQITLVSGATAAWGAHLATWPIEVEEDYYYADLFDSGDPLFVMRGGKLAVLSTYSSVSSGIYYGYPGNLTEIDAWLATKGTARLAQVGI